MLTDIVQSRGSLMQSLLLGRQLGRATLATQDAQCLYHGSALSKTVNIYLHFLPVFKNENRSLAKVGTV